MYHIFGCDRNNEFGNGMWCTRLLITLRIVRTPLKTKKKVLQNVTNVLNLRESHILYHIKLSN